MTPIIYFHSVAPHKNPSWSRSYLTLELKHFENLLKYFSFRKCKTIHLDDYFDQMETGELKTNEVCITFDDGYADFWIYVYPLLKKYNQKATVYVSPGLVDQINGVRKNLDDVWNGTASMKEIDRWGYLSWEEMRIMEKSGLVDVQSHTYTHTKYFIDGKIKNFHRPGADCFNVIGNLFPDKKAGYIEDQGFETLIPYGYPIFTEASAVIARRVTINPKFISEVVELLKGNNWKAPYYFQELMQKVAPLHQQYIDSKTLITHSETENEFQERVRFEILESKNQLEKHLNKKISYCCWPHGDNSEFAHQTALESGYRATTLGSKQKFESKSNRIPTRIGIGTFKDIESLTMLKNIYKIEAARKVFPFYQFQNLYNYIYYGKKS